MKGGYRASNPGGRPKGSKDSKPRKPRKMTEAQAEAQQLQQLLSLGIKAKKKFYHEFLVRVANKDGKQVPLSIAEKNLLNKLTIELAAERDTLTEFEPGVSEGLQPLEYMLRVMNDPKEDKEMRVRMACAAAPFIHPKAGESGKKEGKEERAVEAARGKFKAGRAPLALVK